MKTKMLPITVQMLRNMCHETGCETGTYNVPDNAIIMFPEYISSEDELQEPDEIAVLIEVYDHDSEEEV